VKLPFLPGAGAALMAFALIDTVGLAATASAAAPVAIPDPVEAGAAAAPPDTSGWTCSQCSFIQGSSGDIEAGVLAASGANASFGRYTGIDRNGAYADVGGSGQTRRDDGTYASAELANLGLPSRQGEVLAGREGVFQLRLSYDGQPSRLYDDAVSPYQGHGGNLALPVGWVPAASTAAMTSLAGSLTTRDIQSDRTTVALAGRYLANPAWTLFGEFRHEEKDGTGLTSGSFLTEAVQLPQPINTVTDSLEAGAAWASRIASLRVSYNGSWFDQRIDSLTFTNPYLPIVPGSTTGQLALPPSNSLQELTASATLKLPWWATTLTGTGSLGRMLQNAPFLPVSTLPGAATLTPGSLDGDVHVSHYALGLGSRPLPKLSVRGNAVYDGRDDRTAPLTFGYIVTDTFPGGTVTTPRFGEDRTRLDGGADYALWRWLRLGVGGQFQENHYAPGQVLNHSQDVESWGRGTLGPLAGVSVTLKAGNGLRKTSTFDTAVLPAGENTQLLAYDYAPRDRVFTTVTASWAATATITWTIEAFEANDDYRSSTLGLQSAHDRRASTTLTWTPHPTLSAYLNGGYQRLFTLQSGATGVVSSPWQLHDTERYWNLSAGGRWDVSPRWSVGLDALHAPSYEVTDSLLGGLAQPFPQDWTKLDTLYLSLGYQWTPAWRVRLRYVHEAYNSSDWALDGVGPATLSNVLALGLQPWRDNVNIVALTFRYSFDAQGARAKP
jgi:MtrB/PioB family decaheme-associated outer membrane protein